MRALIFALVTTVSVSALHAQAPASNVATAAAPAVVKRSMVKVSTPADGAMLQGSPATFDVTFVHTMTLKSVTLMDAAGKKIPVTATPQQTAEASARIGLPTLKPGTYKLLWVGVGGSGREMSGDLSFMVH